MADSFSVPSGCGVFHSERNGTTSRTVRPLFTLQRGPFKARLPPSCRLMKIHPIQALVVCQILATFAAENKQRTDLAACNLSKTMLKPALESSSEGFGADANDALIQPNPSLPVSAPRKQAYLFYNR